MNRIVHHRLTWLALAAALLSVLLLNTRHPAAANTGAQRDSVRVFVNYAPGRKTDVQRALGNARAQVHYAFDALDSYVVTLPAAALDGIRRNPHVTLVEEDAPRQLFAADFGPAQIAALAASLSPQVTPYGVNTVQAPDVWAAGYNGSGRTICIIDSGYYAAHEDLPDGVPGSSQVSGEAYTEDWGSHGTHVAGTIAASDNGVGVVGVAPGVNLYIVKIFDNTGTWTSSSNLINAANTCEANGANIISMSLGGSRAVRTEDRGFQQLYSRGILSIAAAGNDGTTANSYPASYSSVVSVAATDSNNAHASFSQRNSQVELAAPGVSVLSTVSYDQTAELVSGGVAYSGAAIEFAATGSGSGTLVSGGLCDSVGSWGGRVVLCERGVISFYDKVRNAQSGGATAVAIYNNVAGGFSGTLGAGNSSTIPAITLSQADGQFLVANRLGLSATINSSFSQPASGYALFDGTSMATPHVAAVAALVWSANPAWSNADIRNALATTALDLGAGGRDNLYGYGLVQAKAALDYLLGDVEPPPPPTGAMHVSAIDMSYARKGRNYEVRSTVTIVDAANAPVANATVSVSVALPGGGTATGSGTTGSDGKVTFTVTNRDAGTYTATVTNVTHASLTYSPTANVVTSAAIIVQ